MLWKPFRPCFLGRLDLHRVGFFSARKDYNSVIIRGIVTSGPDSLDADVGICSNLYMDTNTAITREQWLIDLAALLASEIFEPAGYQVPDRMRYTCGWPSTRSTAKLARIGECWTPICSADGTVEIMISPMLDDPMRIAGVLAHEMIHASVGVEHGHRKLFSQAMRAIGLEGKPTATTESEAFKRAVTPMLEKLGDYPHAKLTGTNTRKKQSTRMVKLECPGCGFIIRTTRKWLEAQGAPRCSCEDYYFFEEA